MLNGFMEVLAHLDLHGERVGPRGMVTLEVENLTYQLPAYERFMSFPSRKLSLDYIRDELRWYLKGDKTDLSITEKAAIWKTAVTNGMLNSNYGYYLFTCQGLQYAVDVLRNDNDSRRAVIPILAAEHLRLDSNDVPCTVSLGFRIRRGELCCTVHMRSQDAIYGMGNDAPFFSIVQEMVAQLLGNLPLGPLTVFVESFHVYERHFEMLSRIINRREQLAPIGCPRIASASEVKLLLANRISEAERTYAFSWWLTHGDSGI